MFILKPRREREWIIIYEMIRMFCLENHTTSETLCKECNELYIYAVNRLKSCVFGDNKPVCKNCPVHCYSAKRRELIRSVMQYSGPRMLVHRPLFAITHVVDNITASKPKRSELKNE